MTTITTTNATEDEPHQFSAWASELRLPPGRWPKTLATELGNGLPLVLSRLTESAGTYHQTAGCITLTVWND